IEDGGGWHWDTLTEDMDLSYRVQFAGWKTLFLHDLVVPAEIPEDVNAFKSQQFRWAKGSIQTALKLLPTLMRQPVPVFQKIQAVFHMSHYMVHPMMLTLSLLALPVLLTLDMSLGPLAFGAVAVALALSMMAPSTLYLVSQRAAYPDWPQRMTALPFLVIVGVGLAVSNTRAVLEAFMGRESGFIRTPKRGDAERKRYRVGLPAWSILEIGVGLYCAVSLHVYLVAGKYLIGPFLAIYAAGFLFTGLLTIAHRLGFER
ncbi:MAG TPA: glycosyltransferase, partial [Desulfosarcina sp.]|nr:glycosyltransferase [Desulfosarcina sp.]